MKKFFWTFKHYLLVFYLFIFTFLSRSSHPYSQFFFSPLKWFPDRFFTFLSLSDSDICGLSICLDAGERFLYFLSWLQSLNSSLQTHIWGVGILTVGLVLRVHRRNMKKQQSRPFLSSLGTHERRLSSVRKSVHAWHFPAGHRRLGQPTEPGLADSGWGPSHGVG